MKELNSKLSTLQSFLRGIPKSSILSYHTLTAIVTLILYDLQKWNGLQFWPGPSPTGNRIHWQLQPRVAYPVMAQSAGIA